MVGLDLGNLLVHLKADNSQFKRIMKSSVATIKRATKITAVAAGAYSVASVKAFASFDDAMVKSLAIMGDVTDGMKEDMRSLALQLSTESVTSAKELGKAYFYLASAGLDAKQSMASLATVDQFAIAGAFDMALATDLLTDAQSALGYTVKDATQNMENMAAIGDVLVAANTMANATVEQFSKSLTTEAGPAMKAYNIGLEEGVAVLAAYADQGIKGEKSGAMFGRMLRLLNKGFQSNRVEWAKFGVTIYDTVGELKPLNVIIDDLTGILGDMSTEQKVATLDLLGFKARVQQTILPLLGLGDKVKEYQERLEDASGVMKDVAEKQLKSFSAQMKILWNNIVRVSIAVGERFAPGIKRLSDVFVRNRRQIEYWATYFADRIVFVGDVMTGFIEWMEKDFKAGFKGAMDAVLAILKATGMSALDLSIRMGKGILIGIKEGLFGSTATAEMKAEAEKLFAEVYGRDVRKKVKTTKLTKFLGLDKNIFPSIIKEDKEAYNDLLEYVKSRKLVTSIFDGFKETAKLNFKYCLAELGKTNVKAMDIIEDANRNLAKKDLARDWDKMIGDIKEKVSTLAPLWDVVKTSTLGLLGITKNIADETEKIKEDLNDIEPPKVDPVVSDHFKNWMEESGNMMNRIQDVGVNAFEGIGDAITQMAMTGKANFADFAKAVIADVTAMIIKMLMAEAIMQAIGAISSVGTTKSEVRGTRGLGDSTPARIQHNGHMGQQRNVPSFLFSGAPRLHNGLSGDEYPAILQKGETVIPRNGRGGGNIPPIVVINNNTGQNFKQQGQPKFDGKKWVVGIVADNIARQGTLHHAVLGVKG